MKKKTTAFFDFFILNYFSFGCVMTIYRKYLIAWSYLIPLTKAKRLALQGIKKGATGAPFVFTVVIFNSRLH
jgi:hypothetical protein